MQKKNRLQNIFNEINSFDKYLPVFLKTKQNRIKRIYRLDLPSCFSFDALRLAQPNLNLILILSRSANR